MKYTLAGTCSVIAAGISTLALWPHAAMASLDQVLAATESKATFKAIFRVRHAFYDGVAAQSEFTRWQLRDHITQVSNERNYDPHRDRGKSIEQIPFTKTEAWIYPNGDAVTQEPGLPRAIRRHGMAQEFDDFPTIAQQFRDSKILETHPSVHAHGGVFDKYVMSLTLGGDRVIRQTAFVDPSSHLIRFIDPAQYVGKGRAPQFMGKGNEMTWEYQYPDEATLEKEAPAPPSEDQIDDTVDLKKQFLKDLETPVGTQVVDGIKKSLYGIVIHTRGFVTVVTEGGDPRDVTDPHKVEIAGFKAVDPNAPGAAVGKFLALVNRTQDKPLWFTGFKTVGGKQYVVEGVQVKLNGAVPKQLTVKVPVWKYDLKHPIKTGKDAEVRVVYHSVFVGYATFTTDRIYMMGGASGWGYEQLPSDYQIGSHKGKSGSTSRATVSKR